MNMTKRVASIIAVMALFASLLTVAAPVYAISGGGQVGDADNVAFGCDLSFWNVSGSALNYSLEPNVFLL